MASAENGSHDTTKQNHANRDGSIDTGLWQINDCHYKEFGFKTKWGFRKALKKPYFNGYVANTLRARDGWGIWSTVSNNVDNIYHIIYN